MMVNDQLHALAASSPRRGSHYPLNSKLGGSQNRCRMSLKKQKLSRSCREEKVIETVSLNDTKFDFRLPPRCKLYLHTSGPETSGWNCHSTFRKIPEECRSQIKLKSIDFIFVYVDLPNSPGWLTQ